MPYAMKEAGFGLGILLVLIVTVITGKALSMLTLQLTRIVINSCKVQVEVKTIHIKH